MKKFSTSLAVTIMIAMLTIIIPFAILVDRMYVDYYYKQTYSEIDKHTELLSDIIKANNGKMLPMFFEHEQHHGIVIFNNKKEIVYTFNKTKEYRNNLTNKDWEKLDKGTSIKWMDSSNDKHHNEFNVVHPIIKDGKNYGYIMMVTNSHHIEQSLNSLRIAFIFIALFAITAAIVSTLLIVRKFMRPITNIELATKEIAQGDLSTRIEESMYEELTVLSNSINHLAANLEKIEATRKEFFANISHELRTPLTYIEGYVKMVIELPADNVEQKTEAVKVIKGELARLRNLVNDLFDLAKIEEDKLSFTYEWVDINDILNTLVETIKPRSSDKNISLKLDEGELPLLSLDGSRVQQIFFNLIDNALRYTENGSVYIKTYQSGNDAVITVSDTGIGIPKEELELIFDRFHRVEKSRSRNLGGTGLGLSIVKRLVELQNGKIIVESKLGTGTKFTIIFPIGEK
ncbi:MAG: transcriptional regulator [Bacillales bacterium]|jgi:signal transduction histidine kinase|nr:transcriptional regulator [Bacillales bacterium]